MPKTHITIKFAQTLDGRIAGRDGSSKWISSRGSRKFAHRLRSEADAVIVGAGTVLRDDPSLTTRLVRGKNPARVIIDGKLRVSGNSKIARSAGRLRTVIVSSLSASRKKIKALERKGVEFILLPADKSGRMDPEEIIRALSRKGLNKILVEGGRETVTSFIKNGMADRMVAVIAPRIMGKGVEAVGDLGKKGIKSALKLRAVKIKKIGQDLVYTALLKKRGFTFVEILVVVGIIALIMLIALPNYLRWRTSAATNVCITNQKTIYTAAALYGIKETDSLADKGKDAQLDALIEKGYMKGNKWCECPMSKDGSYDYTLTFDGDFISDVECDIEPDGHKWP